MSRIFEALQQSESERTGSELPPSTVLATELLRAAEDRTVTTGGGASTERGSFERESFEHCQSLRCCLPPDSVLTSVTSRWSLAAEKFRFLGLQLRQLRRQRSLQKILITSTLSEEGKSFISANLAVTLARKEAQKVLLIDGDLRRPTLAQNFGLGQLSGMSEALRAGHSAASAICYLEDLGLWFLPAGTPAENPLELMQAGRLSETLAQLCNSFDWIIIDSPPLLPLADTSFWSRVADGTLLVTREGRTEKRQLKRGLKLIDHSSLLGVVLNNCSSTDHQNYYARYGYGAPPSNGDEQSEAV
jgi:capsular exopolysaccharide synthesis family protein